MKQRTCNHFTRTGRCSYGEFCKFSHEVESSNSQTNTKICKHYQRGTCYHENCRFLHTRDSDTKSDADWSSADPHYLFSIAVKRRLANCTSKQIQSFVDTVETCLVKEQGETTSAVLETFGSTTGREIIRNVFGPPRKMVLDQTQNKEEVSFLDGFLPFLRLATSSLVLSSALQNLVNPFLLALGHSFDWSQLSNVLDKLFQLEDPPSQAKEEGGDRTEEWIGLLRHLVVFFLELIRRFESEFIQEILNLHHHFEKIREVTRLDSLFITRKKRQFFNEFSELSHSLALKTEKEELSIELSRKLQELSIAANNRRAKAGLNEVLFFEPPGSLRNEGPRHDNDHEEIAKISIPPTEDEILSALAPYIPQNKAGTVVHLPEGSVAAHRDLHFRMLRYNLIADIQSAISGFIVAGGLESLQNEDRKTSQVSEGREFREINMDIYRRVQIVSLGANRRSGVFYNISLEEPSFLSKQSNSRKTQFWERTNRLAHGSLACVWWKKENEEKPNLVFAAVCERKVEDLARNRPALSVRYSFVSASSFPSDARPIPDPHNEKLIALMMNPESAFEVILIQAGPSFFAFEPVLNALKTASIPLSHIITSPPLKEQLPRQSVLEAKSWARDKKAKKVTAIPQYAEQGVKFDLSFLCKDSSATAAKQRLMSVDASDPDAFPCKVLEDVSTLDKCQVQAIKAALTQEIPLIQGPPGTGKTFVGIQIVRALLKLKSPTRQYTIRGHESRPCGTILCVCFTNHALDQFLLGLINVGITSIVRVGGNCKNPEVMKYNLKNLDRPRESPTQYRTRAEVIPALEGRIKDVAGLLAAPIRRRVSWYSVAEVVYLVCPGLAEDLSGAIYYDDNINSLSEAWICWANKYEDKLGPEGVAHTLQERSLDELMSVDDYWDLTQGEHKKLLDYLVSEASEASYACARSLIHDYEVEKTRYEEFETTSSLTTLRLASVVGMTTTYVAKHQKLLAGLMPKIVIVEEAAEVLEAHILSCLSPDTQQLIMIGDHQQLRPKVDNYMLQKESGQGFDLDMSLFERLITENGMDHVTLESQHRMRPQFSRLIRSTIYPNLRDNKSVMRYSGNVPGMAKTLFFLDHDHPEVGVKDAKSKSNEFEAQFAIHLAMYLLKQDTFTADDIVILTPYVGQLLTIRKHMAHQSVSMRIDSRDQELLADWATAEISDNELEETRQTVSGEESEVRVHMKLGNCIRVATVDNYQGEESKIIILSLVRNQQEGHIGFVGIKNRINVMLSRAKEGMYILGNAESLEAYRKNTMWKDVLSMMREEGCVGEELELKCQNHPQTITKISHWNEFAHLVSDGGCQEPCEKQLPCGHICRRWTFPSNNFSATVASDYRKCHAINKDHRNNDCPILVTVELPCGHVKTNIPCCTTFDEKAMRCQEVVEATSNFCKHNHVHRQRCHAVKDFREDPKGCVTMVDVRMPQCNHEFKVACYLEEAVTSDPTRCKETCNRPVGSCGHTCQKQCGQCIKKTLNRDTSFVLSSSTQDQLNHGKCQSLCKKSLICGHLCRQKCHEGKEECGTCEEKCSIVCPHRRRGCNQKCSEPCVPCAEGCMWECPHEGKCQMLCGAPCNRLPCDRRCEKILSCGHRCPSICGEPCPDVKFCKTCALPEVQNMRVDMIMFKNYEEVDEDELNQDPLIVLSCGHGFLTSTLDGHMGILDFYQQDRYQRWIRPIRKDRIGQFDTRKSCMVCREPIVNVFRYGRVINKTSIDLLEISFFRKFEKKFGKMNERLSRLENKISVLKDIPSINRPSVAKWMRRPVGNYQSDVSDLADSYLESIEDAKKTPSNEVYQKTRASILGKCEQGEITKEQKDEILGDLVVRQEDLTRPCKAYMGYGMCMKLWLKAQNQSLENLSTRISHELARESQKELLNEELEVGFEKIEEIGNNLELSIEAATASKSAARIVDISKTAMQIYLEIIRFTLRGISIVEGDTFRFSIDASKLRDLQKNTLSKAKDLIAWAKIACVSNQQTSDIQNLEKELKRIEKTTEELTLEQQLRVLKNVLLSDPTIQSVSAQGHVYQCRCGSWYVVGNCGMAMESGRCADCNAPIGSGSASQLGVGNINIGIQDAQQMDHF